MEPRDLIENEDARDQLVDDATHAAEDAFAQRGLVLTEDQMVGLNDYLAALLRDVLPVAAPPRDVAAEFDAHLRRHKEKNAGRGMWEYMACSRCDDGRRPDRCPSRGEGVCEYPRAVND